jgi:hypothetical protein
MLKLLILIFALMSMKAFANIDNCSMVAEYHAHHIKPEAVPDFCKQLVMNLASHLQKLETSDGMIQVYGFKNMIYVDTYEMKQNQKTLKSSHLLAGSETKLNEIVSLEINEQENKLYVLNRNHDDSSFGSYNLNFIGNVAPLRSFRSKNLNDVINFRTDLQNKEVYFLGISQKFIQVYNIDADKEGKLPEHSTQLKYSLSNNYGVVTPKDIVIEDSKIYILDENNITVFSRNNKSAFNLNKLLSIEITNDFKAEMLVVDSNKMQIILVNHDGQTSYIEHP